MVLVSYCHRRRAGRAAVVAQSQLEETELVVVEALNALPFATACDAGECSLCLSALVSADSSAAGQDERIRQLPCLHLFHARCIDHWLQVSLKYQPRTCPLCKADPLASTTIGSSTVATNATTSEAPADLPSGIRQEA